MSLHVGVRGPGLSPPVVVPEVARPTAGVIFVSGTSPAKLAAGNDSTGTGTFAAPYATLTKALSVVPASGDYLILADGTFSESTGGNGRFILINSFTAPVVIRSFTMDPANFIITNASSTSGAITVRTASASNIQLQYFTSRPSVDSSSSINIQPSSTSFTASGIAFFDGVIEARTGASVVNAVFLQSDSLLSNINFVRCTWKSTSGGASTNKPRIISAQPTTLTLLNQPYSSIGLYFCSSDTSDQGWDGFSSAFCGMNGVTVYGCTFAHSAIQWGISIGRDITGSTTSKTSNVYVAYNTMTAPGTSGHGLLLGENVYGAVAEFNTISSGLQGVVVKGAFNSIVRQNLVTCAAGSLNGLYSKAATDTLFSKNIVRVDGSTSAATCLREDYDSTSGLKSTNTTAVDNEFYVTGASGTAVQWTVNSNGGAICDRNAYYLTSSAAYGAIRGTTVASVAAIRTAWGAAGLAGDLATNDANSR